MALTKSGRSLTWKSAPVEDHEFAMGRSTSSSATTSAAALLGRGWNPSVVDAPSSFAPAAAQVIAPVPCGSESDLKLFRAMTPSTAGGKRPPHEQPLFSQLPESALKALHAVAHKRSRQALRALSYPALPSSTNNTMEVKPRQLSDKSSTTVARIPNPSVQREHPRLKEALQMSSQGQMARLKLQDVCQEPTHLNICMHAKLPNNLRNTIASTHPSVHHHTCASNPFS